MVQKFDAGRDFLDEMTVLKAVRWCISAWESDVSAATVQNCWARSQYYDFGKFPRVDLDTIVVDVGDRWKEVRSQIESLGNTLQRLQSRGAIERIGDIRDFIAPSGEEVIDELPDDSLVQQIVDAHNLIDEVESGDEVEVRPEITNQQALHHLQELQRYEEQQEYYFGANELLRSLRKFEREVLKREFEWKSARQADLRAYFSMAEN
jgi:hypothetical protein